MSIDGNWTITMETPMGERKASLSLASAGGTLTGKLSGDGGSTEIYDGTVNGNSVAWKTDITQPMSLTLEFSAAIEGNQMSGSVKLGMFGNAPLSGVRA
jgi:hypothetical protein